MYSVINTETNDIVDSSYSLAEAQDFADALNAHETVGLYEVVQLTTQERVLLLDTKVTEYGVSEDPASLIDCAGCE